VFVYVDTIDGPPCHHYWCFMTRLATTSLATRSPCYTVLSDEQMRVLYIGHWLSNPGLGHLKLCLVGVGVKSTVDERVLRKLITSRQNDVLTAEPEL